MDTFSIVKEGVFHAEDQDPVPCGIQGSYHRFGASRRSVESLAREFELCVVTIHGWVKQAEIDGGTRDDGVTSAERDELRRLRKENRQFRTERDILSKAAAWFAANDVTSSRSSNS